MIDLHCESLINILEKNIYWTLLSYISIFTKCTLNTYKYKDNTFPHKPWSHGALHLPNLTFLFIPIQNIPTHWFLYSTILYSTIMYRFYIALFFCLYFSCFIVILTINSCSFSYSPPYHSLLWSTLQASSCSLFSLCLLWTRKKEL